jgi:hypothetical protein
MTAHAKIDYTVLDDPRVLTVLFHPRPETSRAGARAFAQDIRIPQPRKNP